MMLVALALAGATASPPRSWTVTSAPQIALVADLPQTPAFMGYADNGDPVQLDLGYSYREVSALWMPFWEREELGFVLYAPNGDHPALAPLTDADRTEIVKAIGRDPTLGYKFPWYAHIWGWLSVVAIGLAGYAIHRRDQRRRDALGLI